MKPHNTLQAELAEIDFRNREEARNRVAVRKRANRIKKNAAVRCITDTFKSIICNN